jgi:hypothetical protein
MPASYGAGSICVHYGRRWIVDTSVDWIAVEVGVHWVWPVLRPACIFRNDRTPNLDNPDSLWILAPSNRTDAILATAEIVFSHFLVLWENSYAHKKTVSSGIHAD